MKLPTSIGVALGAAGVVTTALLAAGWTAPPEHTARLAALAAVVAVIGWVTSDLGAAAATAGIAWLLLNGFLINELGMVSWHGPSDALRLAVLAGAAVAGWAAARVPRHVHHRRELARMRAWIDGGGLVNVLAAKPVLTTTKKETPRG
ncbi:hypothetical protein ACFFX1_18620 [Dactylosporangium sucinum]|uniref:DUF4118 domain-containing protein n=1 Tax=Dactylosporangium sucinum TaxID=1424081 RepID=A0A917X6R0_9ACTN|nr:hypothetical protein [Dactylosporangium sucinum]GGM80784.1 hypothetical protein GCM10007977_097840 [Dactylosporangium sucinum]